MINNHHADPPKSLFQVILPQLSTPSLIIASGILLVSVHGMRFLEKNGWSSRSSGSYNSSTHRHEELDDDAALHHAQLNHITDASICDTLTSSTILSTILQSKVFGPTLLLLLTLIAMVTLQYYRLLKRIQTTSPIPGINPVPNAHPYMGHYSLLLQPGSHSAVFREFATPSGISAIWGPGLKRCASVLLASHARLILRHNSQRDFSEWIIRHGRKTLGEDSLILIAGGQRWKNVRKVVARALTNRIVREGRKVVGVCAVECVDWLKMACGDDRDVNEEEGREGCGGHGVNKEGKRTVCLEAEGFFKLYTLHVFGRVAMGHDFQCIPTTKKDGNNDDNCTRHGQTCKQQHTSNESTTSSNRCNCLTMPPEALAFESLEADIGKRASPSSFINPGMQLYWIPTQRNRTYRKNINMVNGLMDRIIGKELEMRLSLLGDEERKTGEDGSSCDADANGLMDESQRSDTSKASDGSGEKTENIVTHLLQSCIERHFSEQSTKSRMSVLSRLFSPSQSSQTSRCPFTSSSSNIITNNFTSTPPSQITNADKQKIIQDVFKILHTLLVAGYGTTAISLSYVMYCLSKNPRCQERCCEEARRVLGKRERSSKSGTSSADEGSQSESASSQNTEMDVDDDDLPYCRAVVTESIRLHVPILFTTRVISKDLTLDTDGNGGKATLLQGTRAMINPKMIHLDERNFVRAEEFVPERWVKWGDGSESWVQRDYEEELKNQSMEEEKVGMSSSSLNASLSPPSISSEYPNEHASADNIPAANPANFFSFSDGARNCVGRRLAILESTILVAVLFRDMCVGLKGGDDFELVEESRFVTVKPVSLPLVFWKR